ncbi:MULTISPECIES: ABC transporter substrate-binding protein [Mycobacteriaceae]|uniref:ABC transporter substrate-binding protein n=1 Tax=Mycolicibacterium mucogenicum DSM 44124 TaxID=1226753 RepID=A0A8H2JFI8_MYCMU|nr:MULTISPECIES: ABC transporter substrate-binding protein [Mycobacteriaceae]KAB7756306.1 ABC transporter substrate-binding protein [Mycolicibacterium mucogenicum DSM 44124]QPG68089.1 ABC transporter substrate-binding protein [Mycolicibacterium mucogenicum DSM 44124]SEB26270.1 NitT/TauT family transport system substrate-binding protein [Mycobacterium sp. 283mftsu]
MTTSISLALEYFHPWPNSAGFYLARHHGWYAEAGIDLQIRTVDPGIGDSLEHLGRRLVDIAVFPTNRLLVRTERGEPLKAIAAVNQRGLETIRTLASSGISSLAELAGKRVALNPTPRGVAIVRDLVSRAGGDPDAVILVDVGARELTSADLAAGAADATFGSYWAWDILLSEHPDRPERIWRVDEELPFGYHSYLLGAHAELIDRNSLLLEDFRAISERGFRYATQHPEETTQLLGDVMPYFPPDVIARSLDAIAGTWFFGNDWGTVRPELIEPYAHWLAGHGILTAPERWRAAFANISAVTEIQAR